MRERKAVIKQTAARYRKSGKKRKARQQTYDPEVMKALKKIWYVFDCPCGKRLVPILHSMLPVLEKFGEIPRNAALGEKLRLHISGVAHTPGRGRFSNTRSPSAPSEIGMSRSRGLRSWTW